MQQPFYGRTMLIVMFTIYCISAVVTYGGSIAATRMADITEMSRTWFGAGFTVSAIAGGLGGTIAAITARFIGEKMVVAVGMGVVTAGCLVMGWAGEQPLVFVITFGVIVGGGANFATFVPMQTMIIRWFVKRRALATGIVMSSGGVGGALASPLANEIIEVTNGNWRLVWYLWAVISVVASFAAWRWIINSPEEIGQLPDGVVPATENPADAGVPLAIRNEKVYQTSYDWTLKEAIRHRFLWHIIFIGIFSGASTLMVLSHGVFHLMDKGIDNTTASLSLAIVIFASIGGRLISGFLGDRIDPRNLLTVALIIKTVGIFILLQTEGSLGVYFYGLFTGLGFGMALVALYTMMGNFFGSAYYQNILGFAMPIMTFGSATSPLLGGIMHDKTGNYHSAFTAAALCSVIGAIATVLLKPAEKAIAN